MKYPMINKQPRRTVAIPDLVGGLNLRDGVSDVLDNQLTDCKNVWHHNGLLRTRPNLKADTDNKVTIGRATSRQTAEQKEHRDIQRTIGYKRYILCSCLVKNDSSCAIMFWWQGEKDTISLGSVSYTYSGNVTYFVTEKSGVLYCFDSEMKIYKYNYFTDTEWTLLSEDDIYKPLIYINCKTDGLANSFEGVQLEGLNLIGNQFRMIYSTVNKALFNASKTTHLMQYLIPLCGADELKSSLADVFKVKITQRNGSVVTHTMNRIGSSSEYIESSLNTDELQMSANGGLGDDLILVFFDSSEKIKAVSESDYIENNMEIIAPCVNPNDNSEKVFGMTFPTWFGGAANGINGGSRLFLGGNTNGKEGSLMLWSARDNPLYFPENNYAYVGKSSNRITAFGKQDDMLVIFKENEVYYTHYVQNTNITADDLINQNVIDYQASSVYFPIVQLHSEIGCNVPDSVQLCRNRLIWANTNGSIYTLVSANQYSERNIYKLSAMIERNILIPSIATSADWNGYYCLMCFDKMWLLKYDSFGYQYVYSYSKAEDAALKMPWFMWDFPFVDKNNGNTWQVNPRICLLSDSLLVTTLNDTGAGENVNISAYTLNSTNASTDDEILIESDGGEIIKSTYNFESVAQTKIFDFGSPSYRKNVDAVNIGLGNNGSVPIKVTFVTDVGIEEEKITPYGTEETEYNPEFINNYHSSPCIRNVGRFGIRLQCNGVLAVDNLNLQYRLLGGAK